VARANRLESGSVQRPASSMAERNRIGLAAVSSGIRLNVRREPNVGRNRLAIVRRWYCDAEPVESGQLRRSRVQGLRWRRTRPRIRKTVLSFTREHRHETKHPFHCRLPASAALTHAAHQPPTAGGPSRRAMRFARRSRSIRRAGQGTREPGHHARPSRRIGRVVSEVVRGARR